MEQGGAALRAKGCGDSWGSHREAAPSLTPSQCSLPVASTSKRMKTLLAARERALLPCFWDNLNLSTFSKGEEKPFQSCPAKGVTVHPGRPCSGWVIRDLAWVIRDPTWVIRDPARAITLHPVIGAAAAPHGLKHHQL